MMDSVGELLGEDREPDDLPVFVERCVVDGAEREAPPAGDTRFQLIDAVATLFDVAGDADRGRDPAEEVRIEAADGGAAAEHPGAGSEKDRLQGEQRRQFIVGTAVDGLDVSVGEGPRSSD